MKQLIFWDDVPGGINGVLAGNAHQAGDSMHH
jgi:hypothetical protein